MYKFDVYSTAKSAFLIYDDRPNFMIEKIIIFDRQ